VKHHAVEQSCPVMENSRWNAVDGGAEFVEEILEA
jgi:hypothetical protein